ncbi:MAG: hypothetical protein K8S56_10750 [Candidatus Cloacimonetes bacterium]|nr:hypothetical protein [Candidatus Cloacimonadota bacterium]
MKARVILLVLVALVCTALNAQDYESLSGLFAEKDLEERIEKYLEPIAGKTVVIVDLSLRFPSDGLVPFGHELDKKHSLPGLPIAKSKGVLAPNIEEQPTMPTIILQKKIIVYVDQNLSEEKQNYIKENIIKWERLNILEKDVLEIRPELDVADEDKGGFFTSPLFFAILFLIVLIAFYILFHLKIKELVEAMQSINIAGIDSVVRILSSLTGHMEALDESLSGLQVNKHAPFPVQVLEQQEKLYNESMDFTFAEELNVADFIKLINSESVENQAFVLAAISPDFVDKFFEECPNSKPIIEQFLKSTQKSKSEVQLLRKDLFNKFKQLVEDNQIKFDGKKALIKIINKLPAQQTEVFFKTVESKNPTIANEIRDKILLLEDLQKIEDQVIDTIIKSVDQQMLVYFLLSVEDSLQERFFGLMSDRSILIIKEDMDVLGPLTSEQQQNYRNRMLLTIRKQLNYK